MKLYTAPRTCAVGIHLLLEETQRPFTVQVLDIQAGEQHQPAFKAVNPKGKVPALVRDDGSVLTEFGAIAGWIAECFPDAGLQATDAERRARTAEVLNYAVGTLHGQGFGRIFKPERYAPGNPDEARRAGRVIVTNGLTLLAETLGNQHYVAGQFGIGDAALFYIENWAAGIGMALPPACAAHRERMRGRPAVQRALASVDYDRTE